MNELLLNNAHAMLRSSRDDRFKAVVNFIWIATKGSKLTIGEHQIPCAELAQLRNRVSHLMLARLPTAHLATLLTDVSLAKKMAGLVPAEAADKFLGAATDLKQSARRNELKQALYELAPEPMAVWQAQDMESALSIVSMHLPSIPEEIPMMEIARGIKHIMKIRERHEEKRVWPVARLWVSLCVFNGRVPKMVEFTRALEEVSCTFTTGNHWSEDIGWECKKGEDDPYRALFWRSGDFMTPWAAYAQDRAIECDLRSDNPAFEGYVDAMLAAGQNDLCVAYFLDK